MSRPTRNWFRLAVPAMLVIASIVGGLGPVPGASGQAVATTTQVAVVATALCLVMSLLTLLRFALWTRRNALLRN